MGFIGQQVALSHAKSAVWPAKNTTCIHKSMYQQRSALRVCLFLKEILKSQFMQKYKYQQVVNAHCITSRRLLVDNMADTALENGCVSIPNQLLGGKEINVRNAHVMSKDAFYVGSSLGFQTRSERQNAQTHRQTGFHNMLHKHRV